MKAIRTLIDLADTQIRALDELARKEKRSRAGLKRQAIDEYLARKPSKQDGDAFGSGENVGWTDRLSGKGSSRVVKTLFVTRCTNENAARNWTAF
jgi:metal-responsive CopG/Arc/MetJ family transcriptional regulator